MLIFPLFSEPIETSPVLENDLAVILGLLACTSSPVCPEFACQLCVVSTVKTLHSSVVGIAPGVRPWLGAAGGRCFVGLGAPRRYTFWPGLA